MHAHIHPSRHINFPLHHSDGNKIPSTLYTALSYESFILNYMDLIITWWDELFKKQLYTFSISEMAPRHRQAYTLTHIMLMSPPLWLLFQNAGGILYRRTVTNPDNISLVTTPPSFPTPFLSCRRHFTGKWTKHLCGRGFGICTYWKQETGH